MATAPKLDAPRGARGIQLIPFVLLTFALCSMARPQSLSETRAGTTDHERLTAAQKAIDSQQWEDAAKFAAGPRDQSLELDFLRGLALARLQRWEESANAFISGHAKNPRDPRFLVELAGVRYKQENFPAAKRNLRSALRLQRQPYTLEFLATLYFLEGNLEAALKYWNAVDKPRLRAVNLQPPVQLNDTLLRRAIYFNAPQVLTNNALLQTEALLDNLAVFSQPRLQLIPAAASYDATWHLAEHNGFGDSKLEAVLAPLSGLPYATLYPSYYNLGHRAMNLTSLLRWDSQKRRAFASFSLPFRDNPARRLAFYFDARNENWNLSNTFFVPGVAPSDLNLRRIVGGVELRSVAGPRWSWTTGLEVANRSFRNVAALALAEGNSFFSDSTGFRYWLRGDRSLLRIPERRFTLDSSAEGDVGRFYTANLGAYGSMRAALQARWLPRAKGDDYEIQAHFRAGAIIGRAPLDELFQLGVERDDNDLWLRGHRATTQGRKGAAPLGHRYTLANWAIDKNIYSNGLITLKLGPFLDTGAIADSSGLFGSRQWLWDTGAQCKVRLLGSLTILLIYGHDIRGGRDLFYPTVLR